MNIIGILGGNGTMASLNFTMELVKNAFSPSDSERPNFILRNLPPKQEDSFVYDGKLQDYSPLDDLVEAARYIESGGAEVLVMPCNSLHYFYKDIQERISIKFLSIIEVTVEKIINSHPNARNIAVLSTGITNEKGLYAEVLERCGLKHVKLPDKIQKMVNTCVFDGDNEDDIIRNKGLMQEVIDYIQNETDTDVIIAGCTEVPLFIGHIEMKLPMINSSLELAKAVLKHSNYQLVCETEKKTKNYNSHYTVFSRD